MTPNQVTAVLKRCHLNGEGWLVASVLIDADLYLQFSFDWEPGRLCAAIPSGSCCGRTIPSGTAELIRNQGWSLPGGESFRKVLELDKDAVDTRVLVADAVESLELAWVVRAEKFDVVGEWSG